MRKAVVIELPYDRGFPHQLRVGDEVAVISGDTATTLHHSYGIPMTNGGTLYMGTSIPNLEGAQEAASVGSVRMSQKAVRLLESAERIADRP